MVAALKKIAFVVSDNTEEIKNFTALLDGKWLRSVTTKEKSLYLLF